MTQLPVISKAEILEKIATAKRKQFRHGVIAIAGRPEWSGPVGFSHNADTVRVHPVVSALDIRARLLERDQVKWLILLTDIPDSQLGMGIQSHLIGTRVQPREPWQAINAAFKATATDVRLKARAKQVGIDYPSAVLVAIQGIANPPAAPSGLLTSDLLFGTLAVRYLEAPGMPTPESIIAWSARESSERLLVALPQAVGASLASDVVSWVAEQAGGAASNPAKKLLAASTAHDLLPLGLVAEVVAAADPRHSPWTLLKVRTGTTFSVVQLAAWSGVAKRALKSLAKDRPGTVDSVLRRADQLLTELEAVDYAGSSDVLDAGYYARLRDYARSIGTVLETPQDKAFNGQLLADCEAGLARLLAHTGARTLSHDDDSLAAISAARLIRWLALPQISGTSLADSALDYRTTTGWADRALNEVWTGSSDSAFAVVLKDLAHRVAARRRGEDISFAHLLADASSSGANVPGIEGFVSDVVIPIAKVQPISLIVVDGMGVASASSVLESISEVFPVYMPFRRSGNAAEYALAVMPSITNYSRTSLFTGKIAVGGQAEEIAGFSELMRRSNLTARLFHKRELESSTAGSRLSGEILSAISDADNVDVFACVLNTIDDSLAKADPMATSWGVDNVAHLKSVLAESYRSGRAVILVSDHGHIVDRRAGVKSDVGGDTSARSRSATGPADAGEISVGGKRVIGGNAVLAVDETLRYRSRSAGYHGGATPAEMVIPIAVLSTETAGLAIAGWSPAPPEGPLWWREGLGRSRTTQPGVIEKPRKVPQMQARPDTGALFTMPVPSPVSKIGPDTATLTPGARLLDSSVYKSSQRKSVSTALVSDAAIGALIDALVDAQRHAVEEETAAAILGVAKIKLAGVFPHVMRLLNVDQYPVISRDTAARRIVLDVGLLKDQFQLSWREWR